MKRLYTDSDSLRLGHLQALLEEAGIDCIVQNQMLAPLEGVIPMTDSWPELWVEEAKFLEAQTIVQDYLKDQKPGA